MPRTITEITVFIASPSDVTHEREIVVSAIAEWNARHGRDRAIIFDVLRWETSVSAGFGSDGQNVINKQIADSYDVLIGIFWSRFGSPTPRAASGTVEEYHRALERYKAHGEVDIAILFKDVPVDFRKSDLDQLSQLRHLEHELQSAGALTKSFKDDDALRFETGIILDRLARSFDSGRTRHNPAELSKTPATTIKDKSLPDDGRVVDQDDEDVGLFDIIDRLAEHADVAGSFLDKLTSVLVEMSAITDQVVAEFQAIRDVRPLEPSETKPGIHRIALSMGMFSDLIELDASTYSENLYAMANDARDMVRVSYDWIDTGEGMLTHLWSFRTVLSSVHGVIGSSLISLSEMLSTVSSLQRTTSVFNKAKRRLIHNASGLIEVNKSGQSIIAQAIDELGRLILAVEEHESRAGSSIRDDT